MRKQRYIAALLSGLAACMLCGCDHSDPADRERWTQQAKHNAIEHMRQKYGFPAYVTDAKPDRSQGIFGGASIDRVFVTMEHEGRTFTVYISGEDETAEGYDSYQAAEIEQALCDALNTEIPGVSRVKPDACAAPVLSDNNNADALYAMYYDGSNLQELLSAETSGFTAYCLQSDLSDSAAFDFVQGYYDDGQRFSAGFYTVRSAQDLLSVSDTALQQPLYCEASRTLSRAKGGACKTQYQRNYQCEDAETGIVWTLSTDDPALSDADFSPPHAALTTTDQPDPAQFIGHGIGQNVYAASDTYHFSCDRNTAFTFYMPPFLLADFTQQRKVMDRYYVGIVRTDADGVPTCEVLSTHFLYDTLYFTVPASDSCEFSFLLLTTSKP